MSKMETGRRISPFILLFIIGISSACGQHTHVRWGCPHASQPQVQRPLNTAFNSWPLEATHDHPSQLYRLMEDGLQLLNDHDYLLKHKFQPYSHLLEDVHDICQNGNEVAPPKEHNPNEEANSRNDVNPFDQDLDNILNSWDREFDGFWKERSEFEDKQTENALHINAEIKRQEKLYQQQLEKERQIERELLKERTERHKIQEHLESRKAQLQKERQRYQELQKERERKERFLQEQKEDLQKEKRRQIELENMRLEQQKRIQKQREEEKQISEKMEEIERQRRASKMDHETHFMRNHQSQEPRRDQKNNDERNHQASISAPQGNQWLKQLFSMTIQEGYRPNDLKIKREHNKVAITGKRVCGCDETCVIKEFQKTFQVPKEIETNSLKAILYKDGSLVVYGSQGNHASHSTTAYANIPLDIIGFRDNSADDYQQRLNCLRHKSGVKVHKMDKRSGRTFSMEEFQDETSTRRSNSENSFDDDEVSIEVIE